MEVFKLIVLPEPDPTLDGEILGHWIRNLAEGTSGLLQGCWPIDKDRARIEPELLETALLWLAQDLGTLAACAGELLSGRKAKLEREPVGRETDRLQDMAIILGARCASTSDEIDLVRDGVAERLSREVAELVARLDDLSSPAKART